jgi:hypothetical protein
MPEPYKFPELPSESFDIKGEIKPVRITCTGRPDVIITPPCEAYNQIGFAIVNGKEMLRFAFVIGDDEEMVCILEDGKAINPKQLADIACRIAVGSEIWEKYMGSETVNPCDPPEQTHTDR